MKVLQVNCVYRKGSTGKIVYDLHMGFQAEGIDSVVCYGRGEKHKESCVYKTCPELYSKANNLLTRFTGLMYGGCYFSTNRLISVIKKEKPQIVHLHCINGYFVNIYRLITFLKNSKIPTVVTLHAEFMHTANCGHAMDCEKWRTGCGHCPRLRKETGSLLIDGTRRSWKKMKKAFSGGEEIFYITSVSPWLQERAKRSPILEKYRHEVVCNGIDTQVFSPCDAEDILRQYNRDGKKLVLHVTARFADPTKGGKHVLALARLLGEEYRILLVGNGLPAQEGVPENVVCVGPVRDQRMLAAFYSACDVTVLTSKRETFSMICAESLCCDTPVVGFRAGGPEQIALAQHSEFCAQEDTQTLAQLVVKWACRKKTGECAKQAKQAYSQERMMENYLEVYDRLLEADGGKR